MTDTNDFHEGFGHGEEVQAGSPRSFGIVFAVVFAVVGCWPLISGEALRLWALIIAGGFLLAAIAKPDVLQPLNRMWFRFGMVLHRVVNPIVMGFLFFITVTPIALIMRLVGKDPLHRRFKPDADSYWIQREPEDHMKSSMKNQF